MGRRFLERIDVSKLLPVGAQTYSKCPDRFPKSLGAVRAVKVVGSRVLVETEKGKLRQMVDLVSGMGAVILGHQYPEVELAVRNQQAEGISFPLPTLADERAAEALIELLTWDGAESVRFGKNGADVTTTAVRLARAVTGRDRVAYLDYAGHHDWSMIEPPWNAGVLEATAALSVRLPREIKAIRDTLREGDCAALVMEAVPSNDPVVPSWRWFRDIRKLCDETGTLLVLDEMVTGFRMAPGGAAEALSIRPDLACYGKAMANGYPLSAIVGPWDMLKRYETDVFFSLTHGGEAVSLAAGLATMMITKARNAPEKIGELGAAVLEAAGEEWAYGYPQRIMFRFGEKGLRVLEQNDVLCAGYANLTLTQADSAEVSDQIIDAVQKARTAEEFGRA